MKFSKILFVGLLFFALVQESALAGRFPVKPLPVEQSKLWDLEFADIDSDGRLDVLSSNHAYPSSVLRNRVGWRWQEVQKELGLSPTPEYPGWEDQLSGGPDFAVPGLYAYVTRRPLNEVARRMLQMNAVGVDTSARLTLDPLREVDVIDSDRATIEITDGPGGKRFVDTEIQNGGSVVLQVRALEVPLSIETKSPFSGPLFVGRDAVEVEGGSATLSLRDRHGFAVGDFHGSGGLTYLEVVGGIGGSIQEPQFLGHLQDRIFERGGGGSFVPVETPGLNKGGCRGRDAAMLDINRDAAVDLFISCDEADAYVYLNQGDGSLVRETIPGSRGTAYRWFQADKDRRPELAVAGNSVRVFHRVGSRWRKSAPTTLLKPSAYDGLGRGFNDSEFIQAMSVADFDRDGDADLFASSIEGNTMLENRSGRLRTIRPRSLGLPRASAAASWVDVENTGRLDLHAVPQGIYRARRGRYRQIPRLRQTEVGWATANWADLDNDGRRDPIVTSSRGRFSVGQHVVARRNRGPSGSWLEIDLPSTAEASKVIVKAGSKRAVAWAGQADDSPTSQGHSRLYFGFGDTPTRAKARIVVAWTSGGRTETEARLGQIVAISPEGS